MTKGRVEVITSVERRRRFSSAEKQQLVSASLEPGASVSAVAREAGIHPGRLYGWRRQFGVRPRIGFAPVRIAPEATPAGVADRGTIEIEFVTGALTPQILPQVGVLRHTWDTPESGHRSILSASLKDATNGNAEVSEDMQINIPHGQHPARG
jgi:transposase